MDFPDPAVWDEAAMRACLAVRNVSGIFTLLKARGLAQRRIAQLTGMSQSEVSEIMNGRKVQAYDVLVRVAEGLGAPRAYMGLAYDETVMEATAEEVDEDVKRRVLFAVATTALVGSPVLGEVLHLPVRPPQPTPLPSRLSAGDVTAMQKLTAGLRGVARAHGGCAEVVTAVANRSRALMNVPADDHVSTAMASALANLHTMAGWTCVDSGLHDQARACFARAMDLSGLAKDGGEMASAFRHAGIQMSDAGAHNDALKAFQLGLMGADSDTTPLGPLHGSIAWRYALMGHKDQAQGALAKAREQPLADPFELAEMDYLSSCVYAELGQHDRAEALAVSSVRKWAAEDRSRRDSVEADILLASLHAVAGEPDTIMLARRAITGAAELHSVRVRQLRLLPLARTLESRNRPDFRDLAAQARRVVRLAGQPSNTV